MPPVADILIGALLVVALVAGLRAGLFSALGALCGLVGGGALAPWALPLVAEAVPDRSWRGVAVIAAAVALLALGAAVGAAIGGLVRRGADRLRLKALERLLGGVLALVAAALSIALAGSAIIAAGIPVVSASVASSHVLRTIDRVTPPPLAEAMAELHSSVLGDTVLPAIDGLIGRPVDPGRVDGADPADPELRAAARSVALIHGVAYACGRSSSGSGFVAAEDRVVTNAHVVAGVETPVVQLPGEDARDGRVVYFDPVDDLAVIAVEVDAPPLRIAETVGPGTPAAVQGYPYGGPFRTTPAAVVTTGSGPVADIYGESVAPREVHVLAAEVAPGNSGGPLLTGDGAVAGVVFARDLNRPDVGYAMTTAELLPALAAGGATDPVSTGRCLS